MKYFKLFLIVLLFGCSTPSIPIESEPAITVANEVKGEEGQEATEINIEEPPAEPMTKQEMLETVVVGKYAPTGTVFEPDSIALSTDQFKGKYIVLDFWATWCGPCVKEGPIFQEMSKQYQDKNVAFVGISVDRDFQRWQRFLQERNWQGHQYWMGMAETEPFFSFAYSEVELEPGELGIIVGLPKYVMIAPDGKILHNSSFIKPSNAKFKELLDGFVE